MRRVGAVLLATVLGCGGGGGGGAGGLKTTAVLSGRVTVLAAAPQKGGAGADVEPNGNLLTARLAAGPLAGRLDAATDPVDAFRLVLPAAGRLAVTVHNGPGLDAGAVLFDLATGRTGSALDLPQGAVVDVVVVARAGRGGYAVVFGAAAPAPPLPRGYADCDRDVVPGELVAAPAPGIAPDALAAAADLACLATSPGACRFAADADLCGVLARCARLRADGLVRWAEPNVRRRLARTPDDAEFAQQWALEQIRAPAAWEHARGEAGVVVAVVDSGVRADHPELAGRLVAGWDFVDGDADPDDPGTGFSHGTAVAGVVAAAADNARGLAGVLWDGCVLPVRAFGTGGSGDSFAIAEAIRFAAGLDNASGSLAPVPAAVVNLSFSSDVPTQAEREACDAARAAGVLVVGAAGNDGQALPHFPAAYDSVLAVAATDLDARGASYSNRGTWIDLAAPGGTAVRSVRVLAEDEAGVPGTAFAVGTSFAAPHVSGVAALALGVRAYAPDELAAVLVGTAQDVGPDGFDERTGAGIVDAYRVVLAALGLETPPLIPGERVVVRLLAVPSGVVVASVETSEATSFAFEFAAVPAGRYALEAGTDRDRDGRFDDAGETSGRWRAPDGATAFDVFTGQDRAGLDIVVTPQ